jgi:hypothetical protein
MRYQKGFTVFELLVVLLVAVGGFGWIWNIVKIAGSDFASITGMLVLRCVGIFIAPLGAVLGFF